MNGDVKPSDVPPKGRRYSCWKCKEGPPSYKAKLASRANERVSILSWVKSK